MLAQFGHDAMSRPKSVMRTKSDVRQRLWFYGFTARSGMRLGWGLFLRLPLTHCSKSVASRGPPYFAWELR